MVKARPSGALSRPDGESRGDQPLRRLYQKSRALLELSAPPDKRQSPPAPIDDAVSELIRAGKIRPESQEVAYGLAREIVVSACKWGDYYEAARRRRFPKRDKTRK